MGSGINKTDAAEMLQKYVFDDEECIAQDMKDYNEALKMAIEALKADVARWSSWNKTFEQSGVADLISRADAIEALCHNCAYYTDAQCKTDSGYWCESGAMIMEDIPSADAEPMTEEVREALMRLSMCAREECVICKYKDKCNFDFQYEESTKNMNTILDSLMRSKCEVDAKWIPCSERLPRTGDDLLVTFSDGEVDIVISARPKAWVQYEEANNLIFPVAWMPLPKPYREDGEA